MTKIFGATYIGSILTILCLKIMLSYLPTPPLRQDMTQGQFF